MHSDELANSLCRSESVIRTCPFFLIPKLLAWGLQRVHRLIHAGESHAFQMRVSTVECIGVDFVAFTKHLGTHK